MAKYSFRSEYCFEDGRDPTVTLIKFEECQMHDIILQFRQFLLAGGFHMDVVNEYVPDPWKQWEYITPTSEELGFKVPEFLKEDTSEPWPFSKPGGTD